MADPMMIAGTGASILGGVLGASGAMKTGAAAKQMGMYQAGIAKLNADISRQNAAYAQFAGDIQARQYGMGARARMGEILAGQSASGLDVGSGSAKDVRASAKLVSDMDMAQIRANAAKTAYDYEIQAQSHEVEAAGQMMGANVSAQAGRINAMTSILGGASSVADKWLAYNRVSGTPSMGAF